MKKYLYVVLWCIVHILLYLIFTKLFYNLTSILIILSVIAHYYVALNFINIYRNNKML